LNVPVTGARPCYEFSLDKDINNTYALIRYSQDYETLDGDNLIQVYLDNQRVTDTEITNNSNDWDSFLVLPAILLGNLTSGQHTICLSIGENDYGMDIDIVGIFSAKVPINKSIETYNSTITVYDSCTNDKVPNAFVSVDGKTVGKTDDKGSIEVQITDGSHIYGIESKDLEMSYEYGLTFNHYYLGGGSESIVLPCTGQSDNTSSVLQDV
jgi:hypothetical protein